MKDDTAQVMQGHVERLQKDMENCAMWDDTA